MKKYLAFGALGVGLCALAASSAWADRALKPGAPPPQVKLPGTIKGKITVPALPANLAGATCGHLGVRAASKEVVDLFPKWERTATATGTIGSGSCNYSLTVPSGSPFILYVYGAATVTNCQYIGVTPTPSGDQTVTPLQTKTKDLTVTKLVCGAIN